MSITVSNLNSTSIQKFEYQSNLKMLIITFNTGKTYAYHGVSMTIFEDFTRAQSKGKFFSANIRDKYVTVKID